MVLHYKYVKKLHALIIGCTFPMINQLLKIKMGIPLLAHKWILLIEINWHAEEDCQWEIMGKFKWNIFWYYVAKHQVYERLNTSGSSTNMSVYFLISLRIYFFLSLPITYKHIVTNVLLQTPNSSIPPKTCFLDHILLPNMRLQ